MPEHRVPLRTDETSVRDDAIQEVASSLGWAIQSDGRTARSASRRLPSPRAVDRVYDLLIDLAFPGYFGEPLPDSERELRDALHLRLQELHALLSDQIAAAVGEGHETWCGDATVNFLRRLGAIREMVSLDVQAAHDGDPACHSPDEAILCMPGLRAITIHRFAHALLRQCVPLIPRMMAARAQRETGVDLHPGARIGRSFFIDHGGGVVVGETTHIGEHCKIYQGVTLGAKSFPKDARGRIEREPKRHPTLEDHVTVYANATILGGDTVIGAGCTVGGGVFVTDSVPPGRTVLGPKPEVQLRENRDRPPISFDI